RSPLGRFDRDRLAPCKLRGNGRLARRDKFFPFTVEPRKVLGLLGAFRSPAQRALAASQPSDRAIPGVARRGREAGGGRLLHNGGWGRAAGCRRGCGGGGGEKAGRGGGGAGCVGLRSSGAARVGSRLNASRV